MGRTLTIKKGGPSPYTEGWHTVKITSAEYGEWNGTKYIDVYFDGYNDKMNLRCYAKENAEGEEFAIGKLFRFANAGITDALDDGSGNMVIKMNDEVEELAGKHVNILLYRDGEWCKILKEIAPIPFKNIVEEFTDEDVDFWKGRALQYFDKYVKPKLTEAKSETETVDAEIDANDLTKLAAEKMPF